MPKEAKKKKKKKKKKKRNILTKLSLLTLESASAFIDRLLKLKGVWSKFRLTDTSNTLMAEFHWIRMDIVIVFD